jgi:hypothetical protein
MPCLDNYFYYISAEHFKNIKGDGEIELAALEANTK